MPGGGGPTDAVFGVGGAARSTSRDLEGLIEGIPEAFVLYDDAGRILYANEVFRQRMGRTMDELVGRRPFEWDDGRFADPDDVARFRAVLDETLATGEPRALVREQTGLDGSTQSYRVAFYARRDATGCVVGALMYARDVSDLARARSTVQRQEHEFRILTENLPDVIVRYDLEGRAFYQNHGFGAAEGSPGIDTVGFRPSQIAGAGLRGQHEFEARLTNVIRTGEPGEATLAIEQAGRRRVYSLRIRAERDTQGAVSGALVIGRDVSDLIEAHEAIARREREFRSLTENAKEFIGRWTPDGERVYMNPALERLLNDVPDVPAGAPNSGDDQPFAAVNLAVVRCATEGKPHTLLHTFRLPGDEAERIHEIQLVPEFDESRALVSVLGVGRDVTTVVRQRETLERVSRTDPLTGVANRRVLYEILPDAIAAASRSGRRIALILMDVDGFKHLNDLYGHTFGDRLLRAVAASLADFTSAERPPIRLGGDEFVLIADVDSPTDAALVAHEVQTLLGELYDGEPLPALGASIGIAMSPQDGTEPDELLAAADIALNDAKRKGRARVEFHRPELRAASERRSAIEDALRTAIPDVEMELFLQPICTFGQPGSVWGAEALLRWRHPVLGMVSPLEFIPIAEHCGKIVSLGRWVLVQAAKIAVDLNADRENPLRVCVNVSTRQFTLDDVADAVVDAVRISGCDPRWLELELTESLLLEDVPLVRDAIGRLRAIGVGIAIDDFGTGYSALHYLTKVRIDRMKIDKSFVRDVEVDVQQQEIVRALIALASAIDVEVTAEGIETDGQAAFLRSMGCGLGQGFLLATPMPAHEFVDWLTRVETANAGS